MNSINAFTTKSARTIKSLLLGINDFEKIIVAIDDQDLLGAKLIR